MAFNLDGLSRIGGMNDTAEWSYATTDALSVVSASGYFDNEFVGLKQFDVISVTTDTESYFLKVTGTNPITTSFFPSGPSIGLGFIAVNDTTRTAGSPLSLTAGVRAKLTITADTVVDAYSPSAVDYTDLYDDATGKIKSLNVGDSYIYRLNFKAVPNNSNASITIDYDIGGSVGIISEGGARLFKGQGVATPISQTVASYSLGTFFTNGCEIYLTPTHNTDIYDISLVIIKVV